MIKVNNYRVFCGDCMEIMPGLEESSVDLIVCDLPYGVTKCKWDEVLPFDDLWGEYHRIIKENCPIVLFANQPFATKLVNSNIGKFREELIWVKNKAPSGLLAKKRHMRIHENIYVFSKDKAYTYNPQMWEVPEDFITKRKIYDNVINNNIIDKQITRKRKEDTGTRYPLDVVAYKAPYNPQKRAVSKEGDVRVHPTQKPIALLEYLVRTYSNEADVVLDNCMGSGTTGVACVATGRNFIGIEKDEGYFEIAKARIEETQSNI